MYHYATSPGGMVVVRTADKAVIPADLENRDYAALQAWIAAGNSVAPAAELAPTTVDYARAIEGHVTATAKARGYANTESLASYISSTIPQWQGEAAIFVAWRDAVWVYAYAELAKVQAGIRAQPTIAALISELPPIEWA